MLIKRLIVLGASMVVGTILTQITITLIGTTYAEYGFLYYFFTALCIGVAIAIWADKFAGTEMLPE